MGELPLSLRLDPQTREHLQREAHLRKTSEAEVAERIVKAYLDLQTQKREAVAAAIAEADKGVFISSEAIHRWIESWGADNELPFPEPDVFLPPRRA